MLGKNRPRGLPGGCPLPYPPWMDDGWMTYAEAGRIMGIKPESVKRRARSKHWPKTIGNDGLARIRIPDLPHTRGNPEDIPEDESPPKILPDPPHDDTRERLASAETEIRLLRERLEDLTADRNALRDALARAAEKKPAAVGFFARLFGPLQG